MSSWPCPPAADTLKDEDGRTVESHPASRAAFGVGAMQPVGKDGPGARQHPERCGLAVGSRARFVEFLGHRSRAQVPRRMAEGGKEDAARHQVARQAAGDGCGFGGAFA